MRSFSFLKKSTDSPCLIIFVRCKVQDKKKIYINNLLVHMPFRKLNNPRYCHYRCTFPIRQGLQLLVFQSNKTAANMKIRHNLWTSKHF